MTRSLQISCVFHALLLLGFIWLGERFIPSEKLMIVDFTVEDPVVLTGFLGRSGSREQMSSARTAIPLPAGPKAADKPRDEPSPLIAGEPSRDFAAVPTQFPAEDNAKARGEGRPAEGEARSARAASEDISVPPQEGSARTVFISGYQGSQETGGAGYLRANFSYIKDLINRKVEYPRTARRMGWEGHVKISFTILASGESRDIRVLQGSGRDMLDRSAIEAVKNASPFPRPPAEARIIVPIIYRLN